MLLLLLLLLLLMLLMRVVMVLLLLNDHQRCRRWRKMLFNVPALLFVLLFSDSAGNPRRFCFVLLLPFRVRAKNREFAFLCSAVAAAASLLPLAATQYEIFYD